MSKLLKLRQWVTLTEAARSLSLLVADDVSEVDLLQLAIEGQLVLSVHFVNGAHLRQFVELDLRGGEAEWYAWNDLPPLEPPEELIPAQLGSLSMGRNTWSGDFPPPMQLQDHVMFFEPNVWELLMLGPGVTHVEREYQRLVGGPERARQPSCGGVVVRSISGRLFQVQVSHADSDQHEAGRSSELCRHPNDFQPAEALPGDAVLVVSTAALRTFQERLTEPANIGELVNALATKERDTLLKLVIGLAIGGYGYAPDAPRSKVPAEIASDLAKQGIALHVDTVRNWLQQAATSVLPRKPRIT